jgi:hypothetical protein
VVSKFQIFLARIPSTGRLGTSSAFNGSIDRNEYFAVTEHGLQRLMLSNQPIQEYAVQNAFGFFKLASGNIQDPGKCVFVGTHSAFRANFQDCRGWLAGESKPPEFKRHLVLREPGDPPVK